MGTGHIPQFALCRDNLEECVWKAEELAKHEPFIALVQALSGLTTKEVNAAFTNPTTGERNVMANAVLKNLPDVAFEQIQDVAFDPVDMIDFSGVKLIAAE